MAGAYSYDNDARLTGIAYTSNAGKTTIDTLGWGYDAASNVSSFTSSDGTAGYGYDPTNQLTSASYTTASGGHQPANESFSFDANGNRNMSGYTTGSDNLMSSDGTYNYQHDADGNTISRTQIASTYSTQYVTTYTWDYRNRLTDVEYFDNNDVLTKHVHYVYGVFDHLLATEVDPTGGGTYTQIQRYVLDVSPEIPAAGVSGTALAQPDLEFDGDDNLIQRNLVAPNPAGVDAVMAQEAVNPSGNVVTWMVDDHLGSPVDVVNNSGAEDDHIVRSAFGQVAYESNSAATPWAGFGGGHEDPITGLVNDYHRYYDPATARWLSLDPRQFGAGDPNLTRYVDNAPTDSWDSTGLFRLFGNNWVAPWDANAAGVGESLAAYGDAALIAAAGTASGAAAGAATGALSGAAVGAVGGAIAGAGVGAGPGALAGAGAGATGGAIWGGAAGLWNAAFAASTPGQAATSGLTAGAIAGVGGGGFAAAGKITTMAVNTGALPLYHYTTVTAAAGIKGAVVINPPVYATVIPPAAMNTAVLGALARFAIAWLGPFQVAAGFAYKPLTSCFTVSSIGMAPTPISWWIWVGPMAVSI